LFVRSAFGLAAAFLARVAFFAGLASLVALGLPFGRPVSGSGLVFSASMVSMLMCFSYAASFTVVTIHHSGWENIKQVLR
jgi:hypothetical protein